MSQAATDCPACPTCDLHVATPARECHREDIVWFHGPRIGVPVSALLWCPACGEVWRGSEDDVLKAEMAYIAWEQERT